MRSPREERGVAPSITGHIDRRRRRQSRKVLATVVALALTAIAPAVATAAPKIKANTAQADAALTQLQAQVKQLQQTVAKLDGQSGGVAAILAAAPQIIDGLTQLKTGLETLADAYQSVEYGIAQVNIVGGNGAFAIVNPPSWSPDIPDDGNGATTSGTVTLVNQSAPRAIVLTLNTYVRSNEANLGANGPVAQAGGTLSVRDGDGAFVPCTNQGATGGIAVTIPGETIQTPSGPVTNLPLTNILTAKPRTDQTLPGAERRRSRRARSRLRQAVSTRRSSPRRTWTSRGPRRRVRRTDGCASRASPLDGGAREGAHGRRYEPDRSRLDEDRLPPQWRQDVMAQPSRVCAEHIGNAVDRLRDDVHVAGVVGRRQLQARLAGDRPPFARALPGGEQATGHRERQPRLVSLDGG